MIDWTASMQQTFEFYEVDPSSWKDKKLLTTVKSCSIKRDSKVETLGSATFDITDFVGESYVRAYLICVQGDEKDKRPLGTFLVQTPASNFDGRVRNVSMDAYTPLLELKDDSPQIGYYIPKGQDVMEYAYNLTKDHARAPVVEPVTPSTKLTTDFIADPSDNWLSFVQDLVTAAHTSVCYEVENQNGVYSRTIKTVDVKNGTKIDITTSTGEDVYSGELTRLVPIHYCIIKTDLLDVYYVVEKQEEGYVKTDKAITPTSGAIVGGGAKTITGENIYYGYTLETYDGHYCIIENNTQYKIAVDEMGRIYFAPHQDAASMQPVWTYTDDNSSILYPELSMDHDIYGIPNVVEVLYSDGNNTYYAKAVNDDPNSPISTVSRGREIVHRVTDPDIYGSVTQEKVKMCADQTLRDLSSVEYTITYTHGYCPVKMGDCVRFNYTRAGLTNVKAKVISQNIKCEPGCPVEETAVFESKLWG